PGGESRATCGQHSTRALPAVDVVPIVERIRVLSQELLCRALLHEWTGRRRRDRAASRGRLRAPPRTDSRCPFAVCAGRELLGSGPVPLYAGRMVPRWRCGPANSTAQVRSTCAVGASEDRDAESRTGSAQDLNLLEPYGRHKIPTGMCSVA